MRKLALALAFVVPAAASADIIKCMFTEPFMTTTYSMVKQSLTIEDNVMNTKQVIRNVSFQIKGPAQFELWSKNKTILQKLDLNFTGSDGMSDTTYPYSVQWLNKGLHGGCTSNFLHASENVF